MKYATSADSPLESAVGAAGPQAVEASELSIIETPLAIPGALREAYNPHSTDSTDSTDSTVTFSDVNDRDGVRDSGSFSYHLGQLTDHFVLERDDGHELTEAGHAVVQAVIAAVGRKETSLDPTDHICETHAPGPGTLRPAASARLGDPLVKYYNALLSDDPVRTRGTVPDETHDVILDVSLEVIDLTGDPGERVTDPAEAGSDEEATAEAGPAEQATGKEGRG